MFRLLTACFFRLAASATPTVMACALALPDATGQVHVPGDFDTLQEAIDAVPSGATIIVHGGTHEAIHIERALTLVGAPEATIVSACCEPSTNVEKPAILLNGPGEGAVVLERIRTEGTVQDGVESVGGAGIAGGGFEQLLVLDSDISGSDGNDPFGGSMLPGGPGISVLVDYVLLSGSKVRGGLTNYPSFAGSTLKGTAGVDAPGACVALLDSTVNGGSVDKTVFGPFSQCPTDCSGISGGQGGPGVVAQDVYRVNSRISGGKGSEFFCFGNPGVLVCKKPDGPDVISGTQEQLAEGLTLTGQMLLGGTCELTWSASGGPALMLIGLGTISPELLPGRGLLFLDVYRASVIVVASGASVSESFGIPGDTSLTGHVLTLQLYDPGVGLTRPVVAALLP